MVSKRSGGAAGRLSTRSQPSAASPSATTICSANIARQLNASVINPARTGPITSTVAPIAEYLPSASPRCSCGTRLAISAAEDG